ncbi:hypothetical protein ANN_04779 [Periplaneta americana]|uniref:Uncharacterized protein n=1 Tax=Periplaneta americana TaxID=6978 RepID=A0ABQ8T9D1_PERAM|nr:hypothetical protein ANN_04779 [Periplaneta americana]
MREGEKKERMIVEDESECEEYIKKRKEKERRGDSEGTVQSVHLLLEYGPQFVVALTSGPAPKFLAYCPTVLLNSHTFQSGSLQHRPVREGPKEATAYQRIPNLTGPVDSMTSRCSGIGTKLLEGSMAIMAAVQVVIVLR